MRVLWLVRRNLTTFPGGDTIQVIETQRALERMGVVVHRRSVDELPTLKDSNEYDFVHLFHLDRIWENLPAAKAAMKHKLPYTLSTIYWPTARFDTSARTGLNGCIARIFGEQVFQSVRQIERWTGSRFKEGVNTPLDLMGFRFNTAARYLLSNAAMCLPNSTIEWERIEGRFKMQASHAPIPNAVCNAFLQHSDEPPTARAGVICVGRIEPRKNQLNLIRAVSSEFGEPINLTIVGSPGRFSSAYHKTCIERAGPSVRFIQHQSPDQLRSIYQTASVHVSPSWYDTPGLVNLEAGVMGCSLVVGSEGSGREYFGDAVQYSDPSDPKSIRDAILRALELHNSGSDTSDLQHTIRTNYTWERAAEETLKAYKAALK